jgi:hypothetical protein
MKQSILTLLTIIIIFISGFTYNNTTVFKGNIIMDTVFSEFLPGDKLWMVIKRDAGVGDFTITTAKFCPMLFYRTN